ncbi:MAG: cyclic pyranopterin monophosphate synthase MoaC [Dehalococcoidia bacterium]|nr:MAG: cyclic pyranopterin monophosphate synthase MoaC [Dehalococcoidia bacterium]
MEETLEPTRMVDITEKRVTRREAVAKGMVTMKPETLSLMREGKMAKGDVLATAQVAGIMAAKQTSQIIPMCHHLMLDEVKVEFTFAEGGVEITARVKSMGKTGVEMEALTAVAVTALTIYDMCKAADRGMRIEGIRLARKSGGRSGTIILE